MELVYWLLAATVAWCYAGYPLVMAARARFRPRLVRSAAVGAQPLPVVVVVVAIRDEATVLRRRLQNLLDQDYPAERLRIVVVCNGSTDGSDWIAENLARETDRVQVIRSVAAAGKSEALNCGIAAAGAADVLVFADARQTFAVDAVSRLVAPFADAEVGAVTGRLLVDRGERTAVEGLRLYWRLESRLRACESRTGSVVGATGAIYAVRRKLVSVLPPNLILDDVYQPLRVAMQGKRVVMAEDARAFDVPAKDAAAEYRRKRRTMVGNIQLLTSLPGLLSPAANPLFLRYVSHKLLRLLTPFCFLGMLLLSGLLGGPAYHTVFVLQLAAYLLGIVGLLVRLPLLGFASAFVLIHVAILAALFRWKQDASDVWVSSPSPATSARGHDLSVVRDEASTPVGPRDLHHTV